MKQTKAERIWTNTVAKINSMNAQADKFGIEHIEYQPLVLKEKDIIDYRTIDELKHIYRGKVLNLKQDYKDRILSSEEAAHLHEVYCVMAKAIRNAEKTWGLK